MAHSLHPHQPTKAEIIELAALEGHDADIPSNLGSIHDVPSAQSTRSHSPSNEKDVKTATLETDIEKGISPVPRPTDGEGDEKVEHDPNIVDFDGPDDPQNPMNWRSTRKWGMILLISAITFLTPLASSMFAPGVPEVMQDFNSTNNMLEGFMVSVYVLGFAFGPLVIAPLSEMYGRLLLYHSCNLLFIIFTIAAAVSTNMGMFIVFRFLMGTVGGAPMVLGGGTIADLIPREQRGTAITIWMMGPTLGPCVGPIIGGFLTVAKGWRWNFWFVAIVAGAFFIMSLMTMRETSAPVILEHKAKKLRAETGNPKIRSRFDSGLATKKLFVFSIVRPAKMLLRSTICFVICLYVAITYTYLYILFTTFTSVFKNQYHWRGGITGLSFLGLGVGSLIGQLVYVHYGNRTVSKHIERGDFKPEHRLYIMCIGGFFLPIGLLIYGWSAHFQTHYMVPLVGTGIIGLGLLMSFMPANTYLIDVFTMHAASAMAANTVLRSLMAALVPLSSQKMYAAMGLGWGNSLLAFVSLALVPIPFLFIKYGESIRARSTVKL
ncbi:major facilitator superfamily transporter [Stagonosporopsis vannaccii]|nr:major facilitator superfamily transporter [Stagonosporopsis vannaccii]